MDRQGSDALYVQGDLPILFFRSPIVILLLPELMPFLRPRIVAEMGAERLVSHPVCGPDLW